MIRSSTVRAVALAANGDQIVGSSVDRVSLTFSPPTSGNYRVANDPGTAANGLTVAAGAGPLVLTIETHGDCVQKAWYANTSAPPITIALLETVAG